MDMTEMFKKFAIPVLAAAIALSGSAFAQASEDLKAAVRPFYEKLLSAPNAKNMPAQAEKVVVEKWVSIPTPRGGKDRAGLVKTLKGFGKAVPDLKWEIQEMLVDGNRVIVRSIATGTPLKPFFGVAPKGNSFKIMTIDIHTVENGKIVKSYHVEDWARAIRQVAGKKKK
ncbi:MAG: polyketide cyclase [Hyphomicrobiaceae bacterium TMED74]|nr:polyketide cyclase [Filomicrobium sp.]RPG39738.1 MAG: polyketide cyclase [Hyphomicrobiaceae bacterium TMED74]